jgi:hypothetical protein
MERSYSRGKARRFPEASLEANSYGQARSACPFVQPVRLSRSVRWRKQDIELYVRVGCDMRAFEAAKAKAGGA